MPGESLSFDVYWNDRLASAGIVRFGQQVSNASGDVRALSDGLDKLGTKSATARVGLAGNKEANVELDKLDVKLIRLGNKVANPNITVEGKIKALADIAAVDLAMDRLNEKHATPSVGSGGILSLLGRLGGGAGGGLAAGGLSAAGLGAVGGSLAFIVTTAVQAAGALAAAGAGVAAFGALAIPQFKAVSGALTQINTDTNAYERATTAAGRATALKQIRKDWADISPGQREAVRGVQSLQAEFTKLSNKLAPITFKVFNDGLKLADQLMPALLPFARAAGTALDGLLKSAQQFTGTAGFKAFLAQLQALSGPAITALGNGLGQITIAVGKLILAAAQPQSIQALSRVLGFTVVVINALTWTITRVSLRMQQWLAIAHQTANKFDEFRHDTAVVFAAVATIFDNARHAVATWGHDVAAAFDTVRHAIAIIGHDIATAFDSVRHAQGQFDAFGKDIAAISHGIQVVLDLMRHGIAVIFDGLRHDVAAAWDALWRTTNSQVGSGVGSVVNWFKGLPGKVIGALTGLGHQLYAFAHAALNEFWSGLKAVAGSVISWVGNFVANIWDKVKKFFGISSPSSLFYSAGKNLMLGLEKGIQAHAHKAAAAARAASGVVSGALGGDEQANRALAQRLFPWPQSMWPAFQNLVMAESGFNRFADNPSSGAYGIAQALPPTKYPIAGQAAGGSHAGPQLSWMFSYIAGRYGNPLNAWAHEQSAHWYDRGGWLPTGVSLAVNATGRPERVLGPGQGGNTYNINVHVPVSADKAGTGRQVVEAIKEFERRSGAGWRS